MTVDIWLALGVCAFVLALFLISQLVPRTQRTARGTDNRLDQLQRRVDEVEKVANEARHDIRGVRMSVQALATRESVNRVEVQVAEMRGEMKGIMANTSATTRSVERIEDFLIKVSADSLAGASHAETKA